MSTPAFTKNITVAARNLQKGGGTTIHTNYNSRAGEKMFASPFGGAIEKNKVIYKRCGIENN